MPSLPPDRDLDIDLESDWHTLGKPTQKQIARNEFRKKLRRHAMDLINRFFAWIDDAIKFPFRLVGSVVTWFMDVDNFFRFTLQVGVVGALLGTSWVVREMARSTETINFCSIETDRENKPDPDKDIFTLVGHRTWRGNANIRRATDFKVLQETAREIGCPLR